MGEIERERHLQHYFTLHEAFPLAHRDWRFEPRSKRSIHIVICVFYQLCHFEVLYMKLSLLQVETGGLNLVPNTYMVMGVLYQ